MEDTQGLQQQQQQQLNYEEIIKQKEQQWKELEEFLNIAYYEPDIEAVKVCLASYAAHLNTSENPVWIFLLGAPGSGKTEIAIRSLGFLPNVHEIGDLSVNSLISGFGKGDSGILHNLENNCGYLTFPDFTTFLNKRADDRGEIQGQLRSIYDGKWSKKVGVHDDILKWKGKVTILAACTPGLEERWGVNHDLGERFMYLRWREPKDAKAMLLQAVGGLEQREGNYKKFRRLVRNYVDVKTLKPNSKLFQRKIAETRIPDIALLIAKLRTSIKRDLYSRQITSIETTEVPTRITFAMWSICTGSAFLDRRNSLESKDLQLAYRLGLDSLSKRRWAILHFVASQPHGECPLITVREGLSIPKSTFKQIVEELLALKLIRLYKLADEKQVLETDPDTLSTLKAGHFIGQ